MADTALRTADSGYLTRKLVDVSQDVIVTIDDCGTLNGMRVLRSEIGDDEIFAGRVLGRLTAEPVVTEDGELIADRGEEVTDEMVAQILAAGVNAIVVRSVTACRLGTRSLRKLLRTQSGHGTLVERGDAVGIIAAQSIGEPGTQLDDAHLPHRRRAVGRRHHDWSSARDRVV